MGEAGGPGVRAGRSTCRGALRQAYHPSALALPRHPPLCPAALYGPLPNSGAPAFPAEQLRLPLVRAVSPRQFPFPRACMAAASTESSLTGKDHTFLSRAEECAGTRTEVVRFFKQESQCNGSLRQEIVN